MTPRIGMIVQYNTTEEDRLTMYKTGNKQNQLPAIVVAVWSDVCINVKVITDGLEDMWKTSVPFGNKQGCWYYINAEL